MSDERIARLTELARRVPEWRESLAKHLAPVEVDPGYYALVRGSWKQLLWIMHPRAADAAEAALRVMVDPQPFKAGDRVQLDDGRRGTVLWVIPAGTEVAIQLDNESGSYHIHPSGVRMAGTEPPAWVEQLAAEWEREAHELSMTRSVTHQAIGRGILRCVAKLRARASGKP